MKKIIVATFVLILTGQLFAQRSNLRKDSSDSQLENLENLAPEFRSAQEITVAPTVYTSESAFLTAIGSDYYLENFTGINNSPTSAYVTLTPGSYSYVIDVDTSNDLYLTSSAVSTNDVADELTITNGGKPLYAFGGYFYNTTYMEVFNSSLVYIGVGTYSYSFTPTSRTSFRGFVFTGEITDAMTISSNGISERYPVIDRLYVSGMGLTDISETKKNVVFYPNPSVEGINVNVKGLVEIYNLAGQIVLSDEVNNSYLSISAIPKGMYIVKITTDAGVLQEKLIKK